MQKQVQQQQQQQQQLVWMAVPLEWQCQVAAVGLLLVWWSKLAAAALHVVAAGWHLKLVGRGQQLRCHLCRLTLLRQLQQLILIMLCKLRLPHNVRRQQQRQQQCQVLVGGVRHLVANQSGCGCQVWLGISRSLHRQ
jgi:hypothetical protein